MYHNTGMGTCVVIIKTNPYILVFYGESILTKRYILTYV